MDLDMIACFCDESEDLLLKWEEIVLKIEKEKSATLFDDLFRIAHNFKGCSRSVGLENFGNFIHKIEDGITLLKNGQCQVHPGVLKCLYQVQTIVSDWLKQLRTNPAYEPAGYMEFLAEYKREFETPESSPAVAPPVIATPVIEAPPIEAVAPAPISAPEKQKTPPKKPSETSAPAPDEMIRVSVKKLEQMMQLVGELSIHQSVILHTKEVMENGNPLLSRASYDSNKLLKELYDRTISLRMHSIQPIFQRLERSILEISRTLGKEVNVFLEGAEVELDKTVCDRILDPLIHMVRNSIDHGVEMPDQREAAGKPRVGTVNIKAAHDSGGIVINIEDDGRGLPKTKILEKAIKQGIIKEGATLAPKEIYALIFLPGFSTAEKVTDISGRGVGLDVVMRTIESLQGKLNIMSEEGKGTCFSISLPTTLSLIDALIVEYMGTQYAVPVSMVDEILDLDAMGIDRTLTMINLRSEVVPMETLSKFLSFSKEFARKDAASALVAKKGSKKVAFFVDRIVGQQQIVVRALSPSMETVFGFSGGTILRNGEPGLIMDLGQIAERYFDRVQPRLEENAA